MLKNEKEIQKELKKAYAAAIKEIELRIATEMMSKGETVTIFQLKELQSNLENELNKLYSNNYKNIAKHGTRMYKDNYYSTFFELEKELKMKLDFTLVNEDLIKLAIDYPIAGITLSQRLHGKYMKELKDSIQESLISHAVQNKGYFELAKDISNKVGMDYKKALNIAITEGGRLSSIGREESYQEANSMGIELSKTWLATLDDRTREYHIALDGQTVGIDENFEIGGFAAPQPRLFGEASMDIRCRCDSIVTVEGISSDLRKDNIDKSYIPYMNYEDWYRDRIV